MARPQGSRNPTPLDEQVDEQNNGSPRCSLRKKGIKHEACCCSCSPQRAPFNECSMKTSGRDREITDCLNENFNDDSRRITKSGWRDCVAGGSARSAPRLDRHARDDVFRFTVDIPKSGAQLHLLPEPRLARQSCPMCSCAMFRDDAVCKFSDPVCKFSKFSDPVCKFSDAVCEVSDPVCKFRGRIHASNGPT